MLFNTLTLRKALSMDACVAFGTYSGNTRMNKGNGRKGGKKT
jgi:hypothetical protein